MTPAMLEGLNPQQRAAVTLPAKHALVLAGAGSGKTRVLTTRMAWLIQTGQVGPHGLLAVTFTNKAAREMLTRLSALLPINTRGMWVGTFHGLCNRLLRAHHREAGLPQAFQILDSADQLSAIKRMLKAAGIDDERFPPRDVQRMINGAKEDGLRPGDLDARDAHARRLADLYQRYQDQCEREGVVDFGELLLRAYELLQREAPIREHYQRRFQQILVDEFQDTNVLQYRWLMLLAGAHTPVFAVGDDDQSIYAFRGANVGNMADFEQRHAQGRVIRLEQNYRSHGHILDSANALIAYNSNRLGKNLWTDAGEGEPLRVVEQASDALEAQWLVDEVRALIREGRPAHEIAILYRSNAQSRPIEHALFSARVPYRVYGGQRFFERQEVKHVLAYLRLIDNPNDDTSWMRVVNFPTRGIGARTLEQQADMAAQQGTSLAGAVAFVPGKAGASLARFATLIRELAEEARTLDLPKLIGHVVHHSGLEAHYRPGAAPFRRGLGGWQGEPGSTFAPRAPRAQAAGVTVGEQRSPDRHGRAPWPLRRRHRGGVERQRRRRPGADRIPRRWHQDPGLGRGEAGSHGLKPGFLGRRRTGGFPCGWTQILREIPRARSILILEIRLRIRHGVFQVRTASSDVFCGFRAVSAGDRGRVGRADLACARFGRGAAGGRGPGLPGLEPRRVRPASVHPSRAAALQELARDAPRTSLRADRLFHAGQHGGVRRIGVLALVRRRRAVDRPGGDVGHDGRLSAVRGRPPRHASLEGPTGFLDAGPQARPCTAPPAGRRGLVRRHHAVLGPCLRDR
ncbi:ATP-dependent DNA helicase Rep [Castellaniella denitrificans]